MFPAQVTTCDKRREQSYQLRTAGIAKSPAHKKTPASRRGVFVEIVLKDDSCVSQESYAGARRRFVEKKLNQRHADLRRDYRNAGEGNDDEAESQDKCLGIFTGGGGLLNVHETSLVGAGLSGVRCVKGTSKWRGGKGELSGGAAGPPIRMRTRRGMEG